VMRESITKWLVAEARGIGGRVPDGAGVSPTKSTDGDRASLRAQDMGFPNPRKAAVLALIPLLLGTFCLSLLDMHTGPGLQAGPIYGPGKFVFGGKNKFLPLHNMDGFP
jgi:hypothetical protein